MSSGRLGYPQAELRQNDILGGHRHQPFGHWSRKRTIRLNGNIPPIDSQIGITRLASSHKWHRNVPSDTSAIDLPNASGPPLCGLRIVIATLLACLGRYANVIIWCQFAPDEPLLAGVGTIGASRRIASLHGLCVIVLSLLSGLRRYAHMIVGNEFAPNKSIFACVRAIAAIDRLAPLRTGRTLSKRRVASLNFKNVRFVAIEGYVEGAGGAGLTRMPPYFYLDFAAANYSVAQIVNISASVPANIAPDYLPIHYRAAAKGGLFSTNDTEGAGTVQFTA